jgi:hypothetical protein
VKRPVNAPGFGIERIDVAIVASHKYSAAHDTRLTVGGIPSGKSECPFQFQLRDLLGAETGGLSILKASITTIGSPSIPRATVGGIHKIRMGGTAIRHLFGAAFVGQIQRAAPQILCHLPPLLVRKRLCGVLFLDHFLNQTLEID